MAQLHTLQKCKTFYRFQEIVLYEERKNLLLCAFANSKLYSLDTFVGEATTYSQFWRRPQPYDNLHLVAAYSVSL